MNIKRYIISWVTLFLLLFQTSAGTVLSQTSESENTASDIPSMQMNMFEFLYNNYDNIIMEDVLKKTTETVNALLEEEEIQFTPQEIADVLDSKVDPIFKKYKNSSVNREKMQEIRRTIRQSYDFETSMSKYTLDLMLETGYVGLYSDGNLGNSEFDLLADLYELKTIYFGELAYKEEFPTAGWSLAHEGSMTESQGIMMASQDATEDFSLAYDISESYSELITLEPNLLANNKPFGRFLANEEEIVQCVDENTVVLDDQELLDMIRDLQGEAETIQEQLENGGTDVDLSDLNSEPSDVPGNIPLSEQEYDEISEELSDRAGTSTSSRQEEEGGSSWPCDSFFCIVVSLQTGGAAFFETSGAPSGTNGGSPSGGNSSGSGTDSSETDGGANGSDSGSDGSDSDEGGSEDENTNESDSNQDGGSESDEDDKDSYEGADVEEKPVEPIPPQPFEYSKNDNSIAGNAVHILKALEFLNSHSLAQRCTTSQFFEIGANINLLSHLRGLDVQVSGKPPPQLEPPPASDETGVLENIAATQTSFDYHILEQYEYQSPCLLSILGTFSDGADQEDLQNRFQECLEQKQLKDEQGEELNTLIAHHDLKIGHIAVIEEVQKTFIYLLSIYDLFADTGNGIVESTGQILDIERVM